MTNDNEPHPDRWLAAQFEDEDPDDSSASLIEPAPQAEPAPLVEPGRLRDPQQDTGANALRAALSMPIAVDGRPLSGTGADSRGLDDDDDDDDDDDADDVNGDDGDDTRKTLAASETTARSAAPDAEDSGRFVWGLRPSARDSATPPPTQALSVESKPLAAESVAPEPAAPVVAVPVAPESVVPVAAEPVVVPAVPVAAEPVAPVRAIPVPLVSVPQVSEPTGPEGDADSSSADPRPVTASGYPVEPPITMEDVLASPSPRRAAREAAAREAAAREFAALDSATPDSAPVDPAPVDPAPADSTRVNSTPAGPASAGSAPLGPVAISPTPVGAAPVVPVPVGAAPVVAAPVGAVPVSPAPLNPFRVEASAVVDPPALQPAAWTRPESVAPAASRGFAPATPGDARFAPGQFMPLASELEPAPVEESRRESMSTAQKTLLWVSGVVIVGLIVAIAVILGMRMTTAAASAMLLPFLPALPTRRRAAHGTPELV